MDLDEISALQNIFCYSDLTKNDEFAIMNLFVHNLPLSKRSLYDLRSTRLEAPYDLRSTRLEVPYDLRSTRLIKSEMANPPESAEVVADITILSKLKKSPNNSDEMNQRIQKYILKIFENLLYILAP